MSVTKVEKDPETLAVTVTAELTATLQRAWKLCGPTPASSSSSGGGANATARGGLVRAMK